MARALPDSFLSEALLLDVEVSQKGRILKIGAALGNRTFVGTQGMSQEGAWGALTQMVQKARFLLGHNLVRHDLPILQKTSPRHPLLRLPVIDTLVLSPIAFPENPYHHLVKDYKLVSESVNDPLADAYQAAKLFADEYHAIAGLQETEPALFQLLFYLLCTKGKANEPLTRGMAILFRAIGGKAASQDQALEITRELFRSRGCSSVPVETSLIQETESRHALAYTVTWLRVSGSKSVLPPWVRLHHPMVGSLIHRLREVPCQSEDCSYCRQVHNARHQLQRFFNLQDFRPVPASTAGGSLQKEIVETGMRGESLLAIMPTGGGKSLCYQLPALTRNYRRGVLTLVISPLQALMKDQVDGLVRRTGTPFAAALSGLLTPPERGDVLRRVRLGDVAILYISPEQLRNRSFRKAIEQREIGCWVFDEAHCLSKWGHDFRPDYLHAGRFIRELARSQNAQIPPIACFTATAKKDVIKEITDYFKRETGRELILFQGGVQRDNLRFEVQTVSDCGKLERVCDLLADRLPAEGEGSAIVFRATRTLARESAEYLQQKGWRATHFHAGLSAPEKKRVQDEFLSGDTRVICATNAFGMGIDKEDVRLVIHADTPGSIENYLQEAGRAGRDGYLSECILLYDEGDCEKQFRLGALSQLSRHDISQILRAIRKSQRAGQDQIVITPGEILRDEDIDTSIDLEDTHADTKVRTAVAWLERAGFLQRNENNTSVFQARLLVQKMEEAETIMAKLNLSSNEKSLWTAILREFMNAESTDSLSVDQLALLPEFRAYTGQIDFERTSEGSDAKGKVGKDNEEKNHLRERALTYAENSNPAYTSAKIIRILNNMVQAGLMKRDTLLTAFVRYAANNHSKLRLQLILQIERRMIDLLIQEDPDPEGWLPLSVRLLNQRLCDEELPSSPELLRPLLKSLSEDGRGFAGSHGSIELRYLDRENYRIRLRRSWSAVAELAEKRRKVAALVFDVLWKKIPSDSPPREDVLVEFAFEELHAAVEHDSHLRTEIKDISVALERALMYLHEQQVILLQQGLAIFRTAMTIKVLPEARKEKYSAVYYRPLNDHYHQRVFQVHVMSEYAQRGLRHIPEALGLVVAYFSLEKELFIRRYFNTKPELLQRATSAQSYQRIVTDLANPAQTRIVTASHYQNMVILAGPGSGKTKTVVHRCAYLLRVERVRPRSILVCCFNRRAAIELRQRLSALVGEESRGITILTYHSLAMRLLGYSFCIGKTSPHSDQNLATLIPKATELLQGKNIPPGMETDEIRDRLMGGFRFILVDEYQDIDEHQYELIGALAGRTRKDSESKLSILAVGDDDQNIYTFRGANVRFIQQFQNDYRARVYYLVENFRSTQYIIQAANQFIAANSDRMKTGHPIRIDRHRELLPPGGEFGQIDPLTKGKVQILRVRNRLAQSHAVLQEVRRLHRMGVTSPSCIAVLARTHHDLAQIRWWAEQSEIPVRWWAGRMKIPSLSHIREIHRFLQHLGENRNSLIRASDVIRQSEDLLFKHPGNPWIQFLRHTLEAWRIESGDAELPLQATLDFVYETCVESRQDLSYGDGITLSTVHAAKGSEFDHVLLIGAWPQLPNRERCEEERRLFYVGMTRARHSLTVLDRADVHPSLARTLSGPAVIHRDFDHDFIIEREKAHSTLIHIDYDQLGLEDFFLGYAGHFGPQHPIHTALSSLQPGDRLSLQRQGNCLVLLDSNGICVARLSRKACSKWSDHWSAIREVRVLALVQRSKDQDSDAALRQQYAVSEWEVPVCEVLYEKDHSIAQGLEPL